MKITGIFATPVLGPITILLTNFLLIFYHGFVFANIPYALGFSIIALTLFFRIVLYPFTASQIRTSVKMQKIAPHVNKLKELHKNDSKKLQEETMKLYKEHGVNPAAGCLPMIIQLPFIWALYALLQYVVKTAPTQVLTAVNNVVYFPFLKLPMVWDQHFFGLSLGQAPADMFKHGMVWILIFPALTAALQFIQSKMMFNTPAPEPGAQKKDDLSSAMQTQSLYIFPIMIGFFSYTLPFGLTLYWNTFTLFGILQQYLVAGWGGLESHIEKFLRRK